MSDIPDGIVLKRHRDLGYRQRWVWARRGLLGVVFVACAVGLANVFGQRPETSRSATPAATLSVYSPSSVRGGLLYTSRFHVTSHTNLRKVLLVLDSGWFEGMQVNSVIPQPVSQSSRNGRVVFDLGHLAAGDSSIVWVQFQVNPTNVGHRSQNVELDDGPKRLLSVHRTITIFP